MNKQFGFAVVIAALVVAAAHPRVAAAGGEQGTHVHDGSGMMDECQAMMARHAQMEEEMALMDARLDRLIAAIDKSRGKRKIDAITDVLTEMVSQRKAMRSMLLSARPEMARHMMEHMAQGKKDGSAIVAMCPMMKSMMGTEGATGDSDDPHAGHH